MLRFISTLLFFLATSSAIASPTINDLQDLLANNKFSMAAKAGEELLAEQPMQTRVKFLTAYAFQMNQQSDKAARLYRELIEQHPELPEPRNNLAMIHLAKGDYDAASKLLVEAINTHNSYATAYQNLSLIYTGIASEAYRRALSESKEPTKYTHKIELAALSELESVSQQGPLSLSAEIIEPVKLTDNTDNIEKLLGGQIMAWAKAWSEKDFATYTSFYSTEHKPNFDSHGEWVEHRRQRILRPGFINIQVSDIRIRAQNDNQAIIDFRQSFESPSYSDRVVKRLGFRRTGTQWKIIDERVLSVL